MQHTLTAIQLAPIVLKNTVSASHLCPNVHSKDSAAGLGLVAPEGATLAIHGCPIMDIGSTTTMAYCLAILKDDILENQIGVT